MSELKIKVLRNIFTENTSIGELFINDKKECYTLEDKDRDLLRLLSKEETARLKEYGETAIGYGIYEVIISFSNKFQIHYPLVTGVVGFDGIRIHCGVNKNHTHGCLLLGQVKMVDQLANSKLAFYAFFEKLLAFKTTPEIAKKLITLHQLKKAKEFAGMYEENKNVHKIIIEYVK